MRSALDPEAMSLADLQRAMAAAVMMPLTAGEEMRATAPDGRAMTDVAASFIAPNSRLTAFERLEIYNRQYWLRVLGALAEDFPAVRAVVGAKRFEALSVAYLSAHPSRSFTLRNLGSKLVEWLIANIRDGPGAGMRWRSTWRASSGRLWRRSTMPSARPLTLEQIATLDGGSRLALQPHVRLLALNYPADDIALQAARQARNGRPAKRA